MSHQQVYFKGKLLKIPYSGPENRHQAAALVDKAQKTLPSAWGESDFSEDEKDTLRGLNSNLKELTKTLDKSALERLADAADENEEEKLWDYYSPMYRYLAKASEAEALKLALTIMREYVSDEAYTSAAEMLAGNWRNVSRKAPISICPWCNGSAQLRRKGEPTVDCKRCKGDGFIYEEEESESNLTSEGCYALSSGKPWTLEDEAKANGYDDLADAEADNWWRPDELES